MRREENIDVYCGTVLPNESDTLKWPFSEPLAVEVELERSSWRVVNVHANANLTGLRRYLRRSLCGLPIGHLTCCGFARARGSYYAEFSGQIREAVAHVVVLFMRDRFEDWRASFHDEAALEAHRRMAEGGATAGPAGSYPEIQWSRSAAA